MLFDIVLRRLINSLRSTPRQGRPARGRSLRLEALEEREVPALLGNNLFPADNPWNEKITNAPVAANSATLVAGIGAASPLHPDFGAAQWGGSNNGIPYNVVSGTQAKVKVVIDGYPEESDNLAIPIPANALLEGDPASSAQNTSDRHLIVYDRDNNIVYETFNTRRPSETADGQWHADSEAVWDLNKDTFRTAGYTSADAAGLPILPGLVRPDEVFDQGVITHALRFTVSATDNAFVYPASHQAGGADATLPRMGERFRLKASVDISGFSKPDQVILQALKDYGMIVADNGGPWFISGAPSSRWNDDDLHNLTSLVGSNFEAVDLTPRVAGLTAASDSPGIQVTISGLNFSGGAGQTQVYFGNQPASFTIVSDTQIIATAPAGLTGTVDVTVKSPYGTSPVTPADRFTYSPPPVKLWVSNAPAAADVTVQADVSLGVAGPGQTSAAGLVARYSGDGSGQMYSARILNAGGYSAYIESVKAGDSTTLVSRTLAGFTGSGTMRFEVVGTSLELFVNNVLQLATTDSTITGPGLVGTRGRSADASSPVTFGNFSASAVAQQAAALPFQDPFTRSDNSGLDRVWAGQAGAFTVQGNRASAFGSAVSLATLNAPAAADVAVQADVSLGAAGPGQTSAAGLVARYSGSGDGDGRMYSARILSYEGSYLAYIESAIGGTLNTILATRTLAGFTGSGTMRFEVVGTSLELFVNNVLQLATTDSAITGPGLVGMRGRSANASSPTAFDNFSASAVAQQAAALPFQDPFTRSDNSGLDRVWAGQAGAFTVQGNRASAFGSAVSLATLNAPAAADVAVQADVSLGAAGPGQTSAAGLVARYSGSGDGDGRMYSARILSYEGSYLAYIESAIGGTLNTILATRTLAGFTGSGTMRFEVVGTSLELFVNNVLQLATTDSAITGPGLVGMRGRSADASSPTAFDNFSASAVAQQAAALPFQDPFTRSDNSGLDRVWAGQAGAFTVQGNRASAFGSAVSLATLNAPAAADVAVQADVSLGAAGPGQTSAAGLVARYSGSGDGDGRMYSARILSYEGSYLAYIESAIGGTLNTILATRTLAGFTGSGTMRFEVVGTSLELFVNNVLQLATTDSAITGPGLVGMRGRSANASSPTAFDNFSASAVAQQAAALPFQDPFTRSDNSGLDRVWAGQAGAFTVQGNRASAFGSAVSLATLNAPAAADVAVQADVSLGAAGPGQTSAAGLVARYSGSGDGDGRMYSARILSYEGSYLAYIESAIGGTLNTILATRTLAGFTGSGTMRFEVVGTSLELFVNNVLQLATTDSAITGPGLVGMRGRSANASSPTTFDNFSAS